MNWLKRNLTSSIGKKIFMAISGLLLIGFLIFHLAGNLTLLGGVDFLSKYIHLLHSTGPTVMVAEVILGSIFLAHILLGFVLTLQNWKARPKKYAVMNNRGGETYASITMPWSGLAILFFLVLHLLDYTVKNYAQGLESHELAELVVNSFTNTARLVFYIAVVIVVGIHVSHGFWSLFQSLGLGSERHTPALKKLANALGVIFAVGFGCLPILALSLVGK